MREKRISLFTYIISLLLMALVCAVLIFLMTSGMIGGKKNVEELEKIQNSEPPVSNQDETVVENKIVGQELCNFDISFLKEEYDEENMIYSPLSIKAALKMLEEGATGKAKEQISNYIGEYKPTNYVANSNMAFANALFVRDKYKIKDEYIKTLKEKYNAEAISDPFSSPSNINKWVKKNTLNIIDDLLDKIDDGTNFYLVNALALDMDWKDKFLTLDDGRKLYV